MKKVYVKPELYAETFALASHIAACGASPGSYTNADRNYCGFYFGTQRVFNAGVMDCDLPIDAEDYGADCYNGPFLELPSQPFGSL
ncbi:MAG: hypothetical protein IJ112_07240 [Oscillospiraceae bacterium]|nr:hypothetical protein [Oscillospiraceae bacterium]